MQQIVPCVLTIARICDSNSSTTNPTISPTITTTTISTITITTTTTITRTSGNSSTTVIGTRCSCISDKSNSFEAE